MAAEKNISVEEVRHMARLSRLAIDEDEEKLFCRQFAQILGHMDLLATVDTSNVEPLYNPLTHSGPQRPDNTENRRSQREILSNAPQTDGESFIVPRIV